MLSLHTNTHACLYLCMFVSWYIYVYVLVFMFLCVPSCNKYVSSRIKEFVFVQIISNFIVGLRKRTILRYLENIYGKFLT